MSGGPFLAWLGAQAAAREQAGLSRTLSPREAGREVLDLAGNDYLGLAGDPRVVEAAARAAGDWGAGATASRLVTGTTTLHGELEDALAAFCGQPAALVFSSGYLANLGLVAALGGRDALVVSDAHVHASLVDACRLSRARVVVVAHGDVEAVEKALADRREARALVLTESVFSVLGDAAPLEALADACARHDAVLVVDEAHGLGVAGHGGRGLVEAAGLAGRDDVLVTVTLSKALGSQGGAVLGPPALRRHLVNHARPFVYDTGLAPPAAAGALAALRVVTTDLSRSEAVRRCARALAEAAGVPEPAGAVLSVPMPGPWEAVAAAEAAAAAGVRLGCFRPPSVPDDVSRLRVTARATLTGEALDRAAQVLRGVVPGAGA